MMRTEGYAYRKDVCTEKAVLEIHIGRGSERKIGGDFWPVNGCCPFDRLLNITRRHLFTPSRDGKHEHMHMQVLTGPCAIFS